MNATTPPGYESALRQAAQDDERILVLTAENRAAIRSLPAALGARFIDFGICEQTMVGAAAGLALRGRIPVAHALAAFLTMRAFEFIRTDVGISGLPVKLVGGVPGFLSEANGPTHQAIEDVALMRGIPGMQIVCPCDEDELARALPAVLASPHPTYVRFVGGAARVVHNAPFAFGQAEQLSDGHHVTLVSYGFLVPEVLGAAAHLSARGISTRVLNLRTLAPIDEAALLEAARETGAVVTIEDHFVTGGLFTITAELFVRHGAGTPVIPIALEDRWFRPALLADVLRGEGFTAGQLAARVERALAALGLLAPGFRHRTWNPAPPTRSLEVTLSKAPLALPPLPFIAASNQLYERARHLIPGGTQTLAKGPTQHVRGVAPKYVRRGRGAHVVDVDGNKFLDLSMAIGPLSLGYCHPEVDAAIRAQLNEGITFSLMHPLEVEVAETIARLVPGADMVRFSKTGADVTSAAVRLARAFTGRSKILACGYHGWHDWYIATTDRQRGIPPEIAALTHTFAYNDLASIEAALDHDTAAVILEPMVFEEPRDGFLQELRRLCDARGALLVFDEMWTGFRCALGGAQERFGVTADLACFSKAIANGMPLAALTGRSDIMGLLDREVFFFTTFGGEALSLAAAQATLAIMQRDAVPAHLERLGGEIKRRYNALAESLGLDFTRCVGLGCRSLVTFEPRGSATGQDPLVMKSVVQQELFRHGVLWAGFHNLSFAHTAADVDTLLEAYRKALTVLHDAVARNQVAKVLQGTPVEAVFRKVSNFNSKPAPASITASATPPAPRGLAAQECADAR